MAKMLQFILKTNILHAKNLLLAGNNVMENYNSNKQKKSRKWLHLLWIIPLILILGCGAYLYFRFKDFEKPYLTDAKILFDIPQKGKKAALLVKLSLVNPNDLSVHLDSVGYKFYIDNVKYAEGSKKEGFTIKRSDTTNFTLPADFDIKKFTDFIEKPDKDSGLYRLEMNFYGDIWILKNLHVPYTYEEKQAIFKPLDFKVEKIKLKKPGLNETGLEATITLKNPNKIDVISTTNYYEFYVDTVLWAKGNLENTISLPKESKKTIKAPIKLDPKQIIKQTGIFGQKDYKSKNFRATLQSTIKTESGKEKNPGNDKKLDNLDFIIYYDGKLGELLEEMKEKKKESKNIKKDKSQKGKIEIQPARRKKQ